MFYENILLTSVRMLPIGPSLHMEFDTIQDDNAFLLPGSLLYEHISIKMPNANPPLLKLKEWHLAFERKYLNVGFVD